MPKLEETLVVRPNSNLAVGLASYWMKKAEDNIGSKLKITDLSDEAGCVECDPSNILEVLTEKDPIYFWGLGHGYHCVYTTCTSPTKVFLSNKSDYFLCQEDLNLDSMKQRVCHLLSCITAEELGLKLIDHGTRAYIGYYESFYVGYWADLRPESKYTESMLAPDCEIPEQLANGKTVKEAVELSQQKSDEWIEYWRVSDDPHAPEIITRLLHNKEVQRLYGDENTKIKTICFIATAAYGSELDPHVQFLRKFRDEIVLKSMVKTLFECLLDRYYQFSPTVAKKMEENPHFKRFIKYSIVYPFVYCTKAVAFLVHTICGK